LPDDDGDDDDDIVIPNQGLAGFAAMLPSQESALPSEDRLPKAFGSTSITHAKRKGKGKSKSRSKKGKARQAKSLDENGMEGDVTGPDGILANAIMYAELLEMSSDLAEWTIRNGLVQLPDAITTPKDGIPDDLENGWVALAPIPKGKRCMAVSYQAVYDGREEPGKQKTDSFLSPCHRSPV
jgi:snurportin-1